MSNSSWCLIESDPAVFSELIEKIGVKGLQVEELIALDAAALEQYTKVYGLIFLHKWDPSRRGAGSPTTSEAGGSIYFAKQEVENACATVALVNLLCNHPEIELGEAMHNFLSFTQDLDPYLRGTQIAEYEPFRTAHNSFASPHFVEAPPNPKQPGDAYHFVAYVYRNGSIWELDGLKDGPVPLAEATEEDLLSTLVGVVERRVQEMTTGDAAGDISFALMAVVDDPIIQTRNKIEQLRSQEKAVGDLEEMLQIMQAEREKGRLENVRRRHNYIPTVVELLKALGEKGVLAELGGVHLGHKGPFRIVKTRKCLLAYTTFYFRSVVSFSYLRHLLSSPLLFPSLFFIAHFLFFSVFMFDVLCCCQTLEAKYASISFPLSVRFLWEAECSGVASHSITHLCWLSVLAISLRLLLKMMITFVEAILPSRTGFFKLFLVFGLLALLYDIRLNWFRGSVTKDTDPCFNGDWKLFSHFATSVDFKRATMQAERSPQDILPIIELSASAGSPTLYPALVHMLRPRSMGTSASDLTETDQDQLVHMFRTALLYSTPWVVLAGTQEQCAAQLDFLLDSSQLPGRLFPEKTFIAQQSSIRDHNPTREFHLLFQSFSSTTLGEWMSNRQVFDAFDWAFLDESGAEVLGGMGEAPSDPASVRLRLLKHLLQHGQRSSDGEYRHPLSLGSAVDVVMTPHWWVGNDQHLYTLPGVVTICHPQAYHRMDIVAETVHTLLLLSEVKRGLDSHPPPRMNAGNAATLQQKILLQMDERDILRFFSSAILEDWLQDVATASAARVKAAPAFSQHLRWLRTIDSLANTRVEAVATTHGGLLKRPIHCLSALKNTMVYHFEMVRITSRSFPKDRSFFVQLSHYLALFPTMFDRHSALLSLHSQLLYMLYDFHGTLMDFIGDWWWLPIMILLKVGADVTPVILDIIEEHHRFGTLSLTTSIAPFLLALVLYSFTKKIAL
eukprot:gene7376-5191_t